MHEAEAEAARAEWETADPEKWATWCFARMGEIPEPLLRVAGVDAESKARHQAFVGGRDSPVETFLRFLTGCGGVRRGAVTWVDHTPGSGRYVEPMRGLGGRCVPASVQRCPRLARRQ